MRNINKVVLGGIIEGIGEGVALAMATGNHNADPITEVTEATGHIGSPMTTDAKQSLGLRNVRGDNGGTAHNLKQYVLVVNIKQRYS